MTSSTPWQQVKRAIAEHLQLSKIVHQIYRLKQVKYWHPQAYDWYQQQTGIEQGSIQGDYPQPPWREDAPHLLIFTQRYWLIHGAIEAAIAKEKQSQGWNVTVVGCDKGISTCDNMMYGQDQRPLTHRCDYCAYLLRQLCDRAGIHYLSMREYLAQISTQKLELQNRDYEKLVEVSWIRLLRSIHPQQPEEFALKDALIASCRTVDRFLTHYLDHHRVDRVIMVNGKFFAEQLLRQHCHGRNIPYLTYERGTVAETIMVGENQPAIPPATAARWQAVKDQPLTDAQLEQLRQYLDRRKVVGNAEAVPFYTDLTEDQTRLCQQYGIDTNKKLVVLFTNSIWDSSVVGEDTIFDNMFDWIASCIDYYQSQTDTQLIIRVHPVEVKVSPQQQTRDRTDDYLQKHYDTLPKNLVVIPPEADASPYTLMDLADLGLVYTSTTGLEMSLRDKPVVVAGNTHYGGTEFVYTPLSASEFLELLASSPEPLPQQVEYAQRYAYMYFFQHMISYGKWLQQQGTSYRFVAPLGESKILQQAGW